MSKDALFFFHFFQNILDFFKDCNKKNDFEIEIVEIIVKKLLVLQSNQTLIFVEDSKVSFSSLPTTNHRLCTFLLLSSRSSIVFF
jgi:hypothetical protein